MEPLFTGNDLVLIEQLVFDSSLEPSFDLMRDCLVWADEIPDGLTPDAFDYLCDLLIARSLFHKGLTLDDHPLSPDYCKTIWARAVNQNLKWTGFQRIEVGAKDLEYLQLMREECKQERLL